MRLYQIILLLFFALCYWAVPSVVMFVCLLACLNQIIFLFLGKLCYYIKLNKYHRNLDENIVFAILRFDRNDTVCRGKMKITRQP